MSFTLQLLDSHWVLEEEDYPIDLCSHGYVIAAIGNEILCDRDSDAVTTSAAALHLMRTLKHDYKPNTFAGQLLPCCGHFMTAANDTLLQVHLHGCLHGIDWFVNHLDDMVVLASEKGTVVHISFENYKQQILAFADAVENFYTVSSPKIMPDDDFDRNGYIAFWNEWRILRDGFNLR
ncbi:MAG: hypothetical protein V4581_15765 [Bacteroidota bacterium]